MIRSVYMLKNIVNINQHVILFKGYFFNSIVALLSLVLENGRKSTPLTVKASAA